MKPNPIAAFGTGLARFVKTEPLRFFWCIRIVLYIIASTVYKQPVDPQEWLEAIGYALGLSAVDLVTTTNPARRNTVPAVTQDVASELSSAGEVGAFTVKVINDLVPGFIAGGTIAKALEVIMPWVKPMADMALTPEAQETITAGIHERLRAAGLLRTVNL